MIMPWGKYKGQEIEDIPSDYIEWVLRESDYADDDLMEEMQNQLEMRKGRGVKR